MSFIDSLLEPLVGRKPEVPKLQEVDPAQVQAATIAANKQVLPDLEQIGAQVNSFNLQQQLGMLTKTLGFLAPGQLQQVQANNASLLRGEVPKDVQAQLQRQAVAGAYGRGYGPQSEIASNDYLRNFGLTSLQLQQQGAQGFQSLASLRPEVPLYNMASMFFTPQQRVALALGQNEQQWNRNWLAEQVAAAPSPLGQFIQNVVYAVAGTAGRYFGVAGGGGAAGSGGGMPSSSAGGGATI